MNIVLTVTNYIGIVAFAVSGSMKAIRKGMDLLAAGVATFVFYRFFNNVGKPLIYADAVGLGAFSASGASLAYSVSHNPLLVTLVGAITAVGGGVVRDLLANEIPMVLTREFYATAAIIGSLTYFMLRLIGLGDSTSALVSMIATIALRFIAVRFRWELPRRIISESAGYMER